MRRPFTITVTVAALVAINTGEGGPFGTQNACWARDAAA
jgi:hypothetical protein